MMLFHISGVLAEANPDSNPESVPAATTGARRINQSPTSQNDFMSSLANASEPSG